MPAHKLIDLTGQRFDRWLVIKKDDSGKRSNSGRKVARWICRCDCGTERSVPSAGLRYGSSKSCGCYAKDFQRERIAREGWADKVRTGATLHVVEKDGKRMTLREWSKEIDIPLSALVKRWNRGWPDERLLDPTPRQLEEAFKHVEPQFDIQ